MKKVAYFTNIAPHYREKLWQNFFNNLGVDLHVFFGSYNNRSIKEINFNTPYWTQFEDNIHSVKNVIFKKAVIYQRGVIYQTLFKDWDVIIMLGDNNIISNWIAGLIAKIRGIPVIFWGHGPYGNESFLKKNIRYLFLSIANYNLFYGKRAKQLVSNSGFRDKHLGVIYNSLDYDYSKGLRDKVINPLFYRHYFNNSHPILIFIGRLTQVKRLELLLNAVYQLKQNDEHYNLMIIGDGNESENLKKLSKKLNISVYFFGASYNEEKIAGLLANADLCVSPGNVGLTSIHAMSYGTPVCTHDDFKNQMPEYEAIIQGETGCFFNMEKNNLTQVIRKWFNLNIGREEIRKKCYSRIDEYYNPYNQTKIMKQTIEKVLSR